MQRQTDRIMARAHIQYTSLGYLALDLSERDADDLQSHRGKQQGGFDQTSGGDNQPSRRWASLLVRLGSARLSDRISEQTVKDARNS